MALTFNDTYYFQQNPDVLAAVGRGTFASALQHFNLFGARELRSPNATFNSREYVLQNDDLVRAFQNGTLLNPFQHFTVFGVGEGRAPNASLAAFSSSAYLTANPDVAAVVGSGKAFASAMQHYLLYGANEGRPAVNAAGGAITLAGSTVALTTGTDNITGTSANDVIDGSRVIVGGTFFDTFTSSDSIAGGSGTDSLRVQLGGTAAAVTVTPASITGIEQFSLENLNTTSATVSFANGDSALTQITSNNAATPVTFSNLQSVVTTLNVSSTGAAHTLQSAKLSGSTDALTVNLTGVTAGAFSIGPSTANGNGYETITVNSLGSTANVLTSLDVNGSATLTKVVATGTQALTLPIANAVTSVATIDASAMTGALTLTVGTASVAQAITGGTGNDVINLAGTYTTADTINGGAGTDRLTLTNAEATGATSVQSNVTNIETIGLSDGLSGTVTLANFTATGIRFGADTAANSTVNGAAGTMLFDQQQRVIGHTVAVTVAGTATTDVLNYTIGSSAAGATNTAAVTINGAETVNLTSQGGANTFAGLTLAQTAATETLKITGSQSVTFGTNVTADVIDASSMTGAATVTLTSTNTSPMVITTTANADVVTGGTGADIITVGAGADQVTNTASGANATAFDLINLGDGFDTVTFIGSAASGGNYGTAPQVTAGFTVGAAATNTDLIRLQSANTDYSAGLSVDGTAAGASGTVGVVNVAQGATVDSGASTTNEFFKLTTGVAFTTSLQATFNAAIGSGTVTNLTAGVYAGSLYDTTNGVMVIFEVDVNTGAATTTLETADTVRLIGTIVMTAADYALIDADNFANFA